LLGIWHISLLGGLLLTATFYDIRYHRIPNWLTLGGWVVGIGLNGIVGGSELVIPSIYGWGIALLLTIPFWLLGWMGAGDIKLVAAVGAFVTNHYILPILAAIAFSGVLLALVYLFKAGHLSNYLKRISAIFRLTVAGSKLYYIEPVEGEKKVVLPYGVAIMLGTFAGLGIQLV
jgi:prepilin peptidase CpaA